MAERPPLYWARSNTVLPGWTVPIESDRDVDELVAKVADAGGSFVKAFGKWDGGFSDCCAAARRRDLSAWWWIQARRSFRIFQSIHFSPSA
jgi:hypothetical protein